jgi:chromatin assembly factor 1 subunit B
MDVFDLSWSPDSSFLISGSIDKHAMVFDVGRQVKVADLGPHNHNVQGVAWDSRNNLLCTLSSDRALRVFSRRKYNRFLNVTHMTSPPSKAPEEPAASDVPPSLAVAGAAPAPGEKKASTQQRLFADETVPTFFRRLAWSPEGSFLVVPCGQYKGAAGEGDKGEGEGGNSSGRLTSVAYVFARTDLDKPALCLPTFAQSSEQTAQDPAVVVRFNPHLFKHRAAANTDADSANTDGEAASNVRAACYSQHAAPVRCIVLADSVSPAAGTTSVRRSASSCLIEWCLRSPRSTR